MDTTLLSKMIGELLLDSDSISLPGLGTFVSERMPATFTDKGFTINPPYRRLVFSQGGEDDGLLAQFYARNNSISEDSAKMIISRFVEEISAILRESGAVEFPGLGRLRTTRDGRIFFVCDEEMEISSEFFGLQPISMKNLSSRKAEPQPVVEPVAELVPVPEVAPEPNAPAKSEVASEVEVPASEVDAPEAPEMTSEVEAPARAATVKADAQSHAAKPWLTAFAVLASAAVLFFAVFIAMANFCPDFLDKLLYSPEELEIINGTWTGN